MNHDEILNNRAILTEEAPKEVCCPACDEPVVFGLRDNHHEFSIGLRTVIECLRFAEENGYVPPLPDAWWIDIQNIYQQNLDLNYEDTHGCLQAQDDREGRKTD